MYDVHLHFSPNCSLDLSFDAPCLLPKAAVSTSDSCGITERRWQTIRGTLGSPGKDPVPVWAASLAIGDCIVGAVVKALLSSLNAVNAALRG